MLLTILIKKICIEERMPLMCFADNLNETRDDIKERMQENKEIDMTDEDKEAFNNATHCFFMW